ncbi:MAG: hypothetical protein AAGI53_09485 [Planctomycetota bacterium]
MRLEDLRAEAHDARVVLSGGVEVGVRRLSHAERLAIGAAMPEPRPPMVTDPTRGSHAARVPDENDPDYAARVEGHASLVRLVEVAVAIGFETANGGVFDTTEYRADMAKAKAQRSEAFGRRVAYCEAAASELGDALPDSDVYRLYMAATGSDGEFDRELRRRWGLELLGELERAEVPTDAIAAVDRVLRTQEETKNQGGASPSGPDEQPATEGEAEPAEGDAGPS